MKRILLIILLTLIYSTESYSQDADYQQQRWLDELLMIMDDSDNEHEINNFIEYLSTLAANPLNINNVTKEDLEQIPFLSPQQIENLMYYLYMYGDMKSINELLLVRDFDRNTFDLVAPFFYVDNVVKKDVEKRLRKISHELVMRCDRNLNTKAGYVDIPDSVLAKYPNRHYTGDPFYGSLRYKLTIGDNISAGINMEKDPGERWLYNRYPYADYMSAYFMLKDKGLVQRLVVGNFKTRFGCGLVMNNCYSIGKSSLTSNVLTNNQGVSGHSSMDEYNYQQGIGVTIKLSTLLLTGFWSYRRLDAALLTDSIHTFNDTIYSIKSDGKHNLPREIDKCNNADMISGGMNIRHKGRFSTIGLTCVYFNLSNYYSPQFREYNRYYFRGSRGLNFSADYSFMRPGVQGSGELAFDINLKPALIAMLNIRLMSGTSLVVVGRYYHKEYNAWFAKSFSEGNVINNEQGVMMQLNKSVGKSINVMCGFDIFKFPYIKYGIDKPSWGYEGFSTLSYSPTPDMGFKLQYRVKSREKNFTDTVKVFNRYSTHKISLVVDARQSKTLYMRSSVNTVYYIPEYGSFSKGWALTQSLGYKPTGVPLQFDATYSLFDTDDTSSTIYISEKNLLYGFGYPSVYGSGARFSTMVKYEIFKSGSRSRNFIKSASIQVKFAQTKYFDRNQIGSGTELIEGSRKNDIYVQLRIRI